jgi:glycosyltransferase involved in cell wall biosynthesis
MGPEIVAPGGGSRLRRLDSRAIAAGAGEVRLFAVMRNEALRLPHFLHHYAKAGVDRLFVVDNGSTDGTTDLLLSTSNAHVFRTEDSYRSAGWGISWLQALLEQYGLERWCVVADADEVFVYPGSETVTISRLCRYLNSEGTSAVYCTLIDMYADKPLAHLQYQAGDDPVEVCPCFEVDTIRSLGNHPRDFGYAPSFNGGMRKRVFDLDVCLDKISLFKFTPGMTLHEGLHRLSNATISNIRGAVLHFKYLPDFSLRAAAESAREEHWSEAFEYKRYSAALQQNPNLRFYAANSHRYRSSEDLLRLGILRSTEAYDRSVRGKRMKRMVVKKSATGHCRQAV